MSISALVPMDGLAGYRFLQRTRDQQEDLIAQTPMSQRLQTAFKERIGSIDTPAQLVNDRELLEVALGAFGLSSDIDSKFFVQKVLEEGTTDSTALANKLSDQRYQDFSKAFGFGDRTTPRTKLSGFADEILSQFKSASFEVSVGDQDESLRIALNADRMLEEIASSDDTSRIKWLSIIGNEPLLELVQGALGLPDGVTQLDLDRQVEIYEEKLSRQMGIDIDGLTDSEHRDKLIERYLIRASVDSFDTSSPGALALTLLSG